MKITAKLFLLVFALIIASFSSLEAQRGGRGGSPEERAERQTKMMTDSLTLSTAQVKKVTEINLKYAKLTAETRRAARENMDPDGDREAQRASMREMFQKIKAEQKDELKVILTSDQMAKFEKIEANRNSKRGERGKRGKRGGKKRKGKKVKEQKAEHEHGEGSHEHN